MGATFTPFMTGAFVAIDVGADRWWNLTGHCLRYPLFDEVLCVFRKWMAATVTFSCLFEVLLAFGRVWAGKNQIRDLLRICCMSFICVITLDATLSTPLIPLNW
jgi:hypothetical protein